MTVSLTAPSIWHISCLCQLLTAILASLTDDRPYKIINETKINAEAHVKLFEPSIDPGAPQRVNPTDAPQAIEV